MVSWLLCTAVGARTAHKGVRGLGRADPHAPTLKAAPYILHHWPHLTCQKHGSKSPPFRSILPNTKESRAHFHYCYTLKNSEPLLIIRHQRKTKVVYYFNLFLWAVQLSLLTLAFRCVGLDTKMPAARFLLASLLMGPPSPSPNQPHSWALLLTDAHLALQLP